MKYKVGDKIKLLCDTRKDGSPLKDANISGLSKFTIGEIYTIEKISGDVLWDKYYMLKNRFNIKYSPSFIEDENYFKLLNRKLKLERILKN